jgi:hypothetical protein
MLLMNQHVTGNDTKKIRMKRKPFSLVIFVSVVGNSV